MFDKIVFISDHSATIKLKDSENITMNLMNLHIVFEDEVKKVLGEVNDINGDTVKASFLGEIVGSRFLGGTIRKPRLDAKIRVINDEEILLITGKDENGFMSLGNTPFYEGKPVFLDVNNFFSGHFAIMGNSGSGKSCGISRLFQNMFNDTRLNPVNANIVMIDSSGEYYNAFNSLSMINPNYHYRFITTNEKDNTNEKLRIPIYLLNEADLALLLQVTTHSQLPIIERMRKLALVFSQKDMNSNNYKNYLIAKAIMTILYTNESAPNKRNEIFSVLASCSTPQFNLEAVVQGIGYTRKFRECFLIDNSGNFTESVLITEYVSSFIDESLDSYEPSDGVFYTLDTLEKALNFTLISEGWLRNKNTYGDSVTLKVRLHSLIVSNNAKFFDVKKYMTVSEYLGSLMNSDSKKYQFVNINLDDVDDDFAKVITKIYSRLIFDHSKGLTERASNPFHLVIEEAHRYIQNDNDRFLIGYNIFERIAKEGRKYGVILGIITQRPVELSDTVISQCSNFLIFKMNHPVDVEYIRKMVPNISDEIVEKQKTLQAGTCLGFGSAFKIPMIVKMEMPNPAPWSGNCDVVSFWGGGSATAGMIVNGSMPSTLVNSESNSLFRNDIQTSNVVDSKKDLGSSLVKMNVDDVEVPSMHAGSFGLVEVPEKSDELKLPATDLGVNLVNLSGMESVADDIAVAVNKPLDVNLPTGAVDGIAVVNLNDKNSINTKVDMDNITPTSLVAFNSDTVAVKNDFDSENVSNSFGNLVSFANGNVPTSSGNQTINSVVPSTAPAVNTLGNISSAPNIDVNMFESTGNGDGGFNGGSVSFVNSEPTEISSPSPPGDVFGANKNSQLTPGLVNFGIPAISETSPVNTFGASKEANSNQTSNVDANGNFSPLEAINNLSARVSDNDGFAPSDMNFSGIAPSFSDESNAGSAQSSSGTPLVSFLG